MSLVELFVCLFFSSCSGAKARKNHRYSNNMGIKNRYLIPETIKLVMCCRPHALGSNLALANVNFFPVKLKRDLHFDHRRTGNFFAGSGGGGGVNHLPKKNLTSCPLRKSRKETRAILQYCNAVLALLAYGGGSRQFFLVNTKFAHKLRHHKQTFGKIATTLVLR